MSSAIIVLLGSGPVPFSKFVSIPRLLSQYPAWVYKFIIKYSPLVLVYKLQCFQVFCYHVTLRIACIVNEQVLNLSTTDSWRIQWFHYLVSACIKTCLYRQLTLFPCGCIVTWISRISANVFKSLNSIFQSAYSQIAVK